MGMNSVLANQVTLLSELKKDDALLAFALGGSLLAMAEDQREAVCVICLDSCPPR